MVKGLVVMSPFFLEANKSDVMRVQMDAYGAAAKAVAERNGLPFVDVQAAFDQWLAHNPTQQLRRPCAPEPCGPQYHRQCIPEFNGL